MRKTVKRIAALAIACIIGTMNCVTALADTNTTEIKGTVFPTEELKVNDYLTWRNDEGGVEYKLYYEGSEAADPWANGYKLEQYGQWEYFNIPDEGWVTPHGVTVNYRLQVMEDGKVKTATAEELGLTYEPGTIRDVPYDSNAPLKRVVDFYALNIENLHSYDDVAYNQAVTHHGLKEHNGYLLTTTQYIAPLSGQPDVVQDYSRWSAEDLAEKDAIVSFLRDWLNGFDFEHMTEMERAQKIQDLIGEAEYDFDVANRVVVPDTYNGAYRILIEKKGVCQDFTEAVMLLSALLGLKCAIVSTMIDHVTYVIQVDGIPHIGENNYIYLDQDWREQSGLGTKHYNAGNYFPYLNYQ